MIPSDTNLILADLFGIFVGKSHGSCSLAINEQIFLKISKFKIAKNVLLDVLKNVPGNEKH